MWNETICGQDCSTYLEDFLNSMGEAFAVYQCIRGENNSPINYKLLKVNDAFINITGLNREYIIGKSITNVTPSFEHYNKEFDKHFKISTFSPTKDQFIIIVSDVSESKKATKIMEKHQLLFNNAQDIIFYATADGCIIDANMSSVNKYGYTLAELQKLNVQNLRHSSTNALFLKQMEETDKTGITFECIHIRKDGRRENNVSCKLRFTY